MLPQECVQCLRYAPAAPGRLGKCTTENAEGHGGNSSVALYASCGAILMTPIFLKKKAGRSGGGFERPGWRSPPGRRVNLSYMLGLLVPVVGAGWLPPTVLVIKRTSTRRLSARPLEVLFDSTGLSLPRPIT
jgi:hypothetical protein